MEGKIIALPEALCKMFNSGPLLLQLPRESCKTKSLRISPFNRFYCVDKAELFAISVSSPLGFTCGSTNLARGHPIPDTPPGGLFFGQLWQFFFHAWLTGILLLPSAIALSGADQKAAKDERGVKRQPRVNHSSVHCAALFVVSHALYTRKVLKSRKVGRCKHV